MTMRWDDPNISHSLDWLTNGDILKDLDDARTRLMQYGDRWVLPVRPYDENEYTPGLREINKASTNALFGAITTKKKMTKCCENCINNDLAHRRYCNDSRTHSMCADKTDGPNKNEKSFWEPAAGTNIRDLV